MWYVLLQHDCAQEMTFVLTSLHVQHVMFVLFYVWWNTKLEYKDTSLLLLFKFFPPRGCESEYVNPYIPTQTPEKDYSAHQRIFSLAVQLTCDLMSPLVIYTQRECGHTWHWMSLLRPGVIKKHKTQPQTFFTSLCWHLVITSVIFLRKVIEWPRKHTEVHGFEKWKSNNANR